MAASPCTLSSSFASRNHAVPSSRLHIPPRHRKVSSNSNNAARRRHTCAKAHLKELVLLGGPCALYRDPDASIGWDLSMTPSPPHLLSLANPTLARADPLLAISPAPSQYSHSSRPGSSSLRIIPKFAHPPSSHSSLEARASRVPSQFTGPSVQLAFLRTFPLFTAIALLGLGGYSIVSLQAIPSPSPSHAKFNYPRSAIPHRPDDEWTCFLRVAFLARASHHHTHTQLRTSASSPSSFLSLSPFFIYHRRIVGLSHSRRLVPAKLSHMPPPFPTRPRISLRRDPGFAAPPGHRPLRTRAGFWLSRFFAGVFARGHSRGVVR